MTRHIWAQPGKKWDGFRFTAYGLDWEKLATMPLTLESGDLPPEDRRRIDRDPKTGAPVLVHEPATQDRAEDATPDGLQLAVGGVYGRLAGCKFEVEERPVILRLRVKTEKGEVVFKGPSFNCEMLRELLALKAEGIEPFSAQWFWYDSDSSREEPHEVYSFFVVSDGKIVRECVSFSDYLDNGFDPSVFDSADDIASLWSNDAGWREAQTRWWYRKFYTETRTGQLMVLRPDEPLLCHYERLQAPDLAREMQFVNQLKIYRLLWIALPLLVAIGFPELKEYMAIAALALGASFLWLCWAMRKVGRP